MPSGNRPQKQSSVNLTDLSVRSEGVSSPANEVTFTGGAGASRRGAIFKQAHEAARGSVAGGMAMPSGKGAVVASYDTPMTKVKGGSNRALKKNLGKAVKGLK